MSSANGGRPDCSFCGGGGLPILPVRYAVARSDDVSIKAPELPADLQDDAVSQIALSGGQHYTLRLLREGFLYVFNAARGRWQGYYVTDEGFLSLYLDVGHDELMALDPDAPGPLDADINAPVEDDEFPCRANPDHIYPGRCITVPSAQDAEALYLAFSDDRWTKRVWKEHATNENGRRDAMRQLSMTQWKGGSAQYARPLSELGDHVAEAHFPWIRRQSSDTGSAATQSTEVSALTHSLAPINGMRDDVEGFVEWSQRQAEPSGMAPALFVLDDPAGVTSDLAALLEAREQEFNEQEAIKRPFVTTGVVNALRDGFRERARQQRADEIVENHLEDEYYKTYGGPPGFQKAAKDNFERRQKEDPAFRQEVEAFRRETIRDISEDELKDAADDAWGKYGDKLRPGEPDDWMENTYRTQLSKYDTDNMRPLASAYVSWLTGNPLLIYLNSRFDDANVESGITFVSVISFVLLGTQSYAPAFKQYVAWLSAADITDDNLLLRGMCLNQKTLVEQVMAASDANVGESGNNPATLPWGPLIAAYLGLTEEYPDEVASPARMLGHLLGPLQSAVGGDQTPAPFLVTLGMISGRSIQITRASMTIEEALPRMREPLRLIHPDWGESELNQFQRKVQVETRSLIPANGQPAATFDMRRIDVGPLDDLLDDPALSAHLSGRAQLEFSAGIVGVALAYVSLNDQLGKMNGFLDAGLRAQGRLVGMGLALAGGAAELVGKTLEHGRKLFVASDHLLAGSSKFFLKLGARLGLAGGVILGAMDAWQGIDNFQNDKPTLGFFYVTSGFSTIGASVFIFLAGVGSAAKAAGSTALLARLAMAWWWMGGILGVIAITATVLIWWYSEDELQEWLAECAFGERGEFGLGNAKLQTELQHLESITHKDA
ncbi:T6SS effector BTH_I2691 family protein [Chromohalobacter sarecensis]|uniref:T6SS effector BTH_I2691 family protein n=1 Tax=Chromohalobacter sarecensis TaxID=245294 RepID=A0ABV9D1D8_9GAMM|nr:T6SS effector BTH_I2691 family protein [Chromohalobacter sarecensis]MCK0714543.1 hypothetical protein [Chromohalobacter sarecensis]